jgi:hypothetical protein
MSGAEWFESENDLSAEAAGFLEAVRGAAQHWLDADPLESQVYIHESDLVLGLDVCDRDRNCVVRTLRCDYSNMGLVYGEDETGQFVTPLTPKQREYGYIDHQNRSFTDLGRIAANWLREQWARPVELLEWKRDIYRCRQWRLADTGRNLCWSSTDHHPRSDLGSADQISAVRTSGERRKQSRR